MEHSARPQPVLADQVLVALRRIVRAVDLHSRELVARCGLTAPQITVLRQLQQAGESSIGDLADQVQLSQATVTGIVDRLEQRQLVRRRRGQQDKRVVLVDLAPSAQAVLDQTATLLQDRFLRALGQLQEWEQTQVLASLQRVVAMMQATDLDAAPMLVPGPNIHAPNPPPPSPDPADPVEPNARQPRPTSACR